MLRNSRVYWHGNSEKAKKQKIQGLQEMLKKSVINKQGVILDEN